MEEDEDYDWFHDNEDVTRKADKSYMDLLNKLIVRGNYVSQFLMGDYWYQKLYKDYEDYTSTLMELIRYSSRETPLGLFSEGAGGAPAGIGLTTTLGSGRRN